MALKYIIGIDEVGRGALAGPVTVSALAFVVSQKIINSGTSKKIQFLPRGIKDSKQLTPKKRKEGLGRIKEWKKENKCLFATCSSSPQKIDKRGLTFAIHDALCRAVKKLGIPPQNCLILLDGGLKAPQIFENQETIIKGDEKEPVIALASIVAKVFRDRKMRRFAKKFSQYGLEIHKGYGTKMHRQNVRKYGPSAIHRASFLKKVL